MLRISIVDDSNENVRLSLEGSLIGPWVEELRNQSEQSLKKGKALTLDLGKLWFMDADGAALLRELAERQVAQVNCSNFITQQLKEASL